MGKDAAVWTLKDLAERVVAALSVGYSGASNNRVRAVPDLRAIRYYTTIGLLDKPSKMAGRTALYSRRHLLQLVCIKRMQAKGLQLVDIQQMLLGASSEFLESAAMIPEHLEEMVSTSASRASEDCGATYAGYEGSSAGAERSQDLPAFPVSRRSNFWRKSSSGVSQTSSKEKIRNLQGVEIGPLTILIESARPISDSDAEHLRKASGPLLAALKELGLINR